jgi:hypothetical protein
LVNGGPSSETSSGSTFFAAAFGPALAFELGELRRKWQHRSRNFVSREASDEISRTGCKVAFVRG